MVLGITKSGIMDPEKDTVHDKIKPPLSKTLFVIGKDDLNG